MTWTILTRSRGRGRILISRAIWVSSLLLSAAGIANATPLNFTVLNPSSSIPSRLDLVATATVAGGQLTSNPQLAAGGLNGLGSMSTLYNDTSNGSVIAANVTQNSLAFNNSGGAIARNATGLFGNNLAIGPGVGGVSGTAAADYGVVFSSPQNVVIPPVDLTPYGLAMTLNLGTLTSIDAKVALRDIVVDVVSGAVSLTPGGTYPQTFDASQLQIGISGTADILLGATVKQGGIVDYLATGVALAALQPVLSGQGINLTVVNNGFSQLSYTIGFGLSTALPTTLATNDDASLGTLEHIGSNLRVTVPVKFDVVPETPVDMLFSASYGLSGKLVGQTPFVAVEVPEPSSIVLGLLGIASLGLVAVRRHRVA
jgi:hypothetical protein